MAKEEEDVNEVRIGEGEWKLMQQLWQEQPLTITQLVALVKPETGWTKATVITMLNRLAAKGAVYYEEGERARRYFPAISADQVAAWETDSFLDRVYRGDVGLMLHAMVERQQLSAEEIANLRQMLDDSEGAEQND